jgi:hypothetical protein
MTKPVDKGELDLTEQVTYDDRQEESAGWPLLVFASSMVVFYGLGVYSVLRFFVLNPETIAFVGLGLGFVAEIVSGNAVAVTLLLVGLAAITVVTVPVILAVMAKYGRRVAVFAIYFPCFAVIGLGLLIATVGFTVNVLMSLFGLVFVSLGVVLLVYLARWRERVKLAGLIFELSAEAVATEKGTLVPSILLGLFSLFNGIMGAASGINVMEALAPMNNQLLTGAAVFIVELGYAWLLFTFMYLADGTIISIVDDWYRNPTVDNASLGTGFSKVRRALTPIIQFGFVMALLDTIARTARRKEEEGGWGIGGILVYLVSALAYGIGQFATYFTLPAMIIEGKGLREGIKRSYTIVWRNWVDVLLAHMGLGTTYTLFMVAMLALYGTAGAALGWLLVAPALTTTVPASFVSILSAVAFIFFGFVPAYFLFRPLQVSYNTILYEFAEDMETGLQLPSRMTSDVREQLQAIIAQEQARPRARRWAEPKFPEVGLAEKIRGGIVEAKAEGLTSYVRGGLYGDVKKGVKEVGPMNDLCQHLQNIGVAATLLESGSPDIIGEPCVRVEDHDINFLQVQSPSSKIRTNGSGLQYHYGVLASVRGLEGKLRAEIRPPAYWKLDIAEKRVVDFQWEGGELARLLNDDLELKKMLLRGGLDKLVIRPDREHGCVRIVHTPGTWTTVAVGSVSLAVGRSALPTREDFEAYDSIAQNIRHIAK